MRDWDRIKMKVVKKHFSPRIIKDLESYYMEDEYLHLIDKSLYIYSSNKSTGKTIMACSIVLDYEKYHYLRKEVRSICFINFIDLINELRMAISKEGVSDLEALKQYQDFDLLVIDDIGASKMTDYVYHIVYSLVNHRYENCRQTIYTSNYNLKELEYHWEDDRIVNRIARSCELIRKE